MVANPLVAAYMAQGPASVTPKMQDHLDAINKADREKNFDYSEELYLWFKGYMDCMLELGKVSSPQYVRYMNATPNWLRKKYDHMWRG